MPSELSKSILLLVSMVLVNIFQSIFGIGSSTKSISKSISFVNLKSISVILYMKNSLVHSIFILLHSHQLVLRPSSIKQEGTVLLLIPITVIRASTQDLPWTNTDTIKSTSLSQKEFKRTTVLISSPTKCRLPTLTSADQLSAAMEDLKKEYNPSRYHPVDDSCNGNPLNVLPSTKSKNCLNLSSTRLQKL